MMHRAAVARLHGNPRRHAASADRLAARGLTAVACLQYSIYGYIANKGIHMQAAAAQNLDRVFAALADPTRRAILARLADGEATVNELVAPFGFSQPTISKHLKVLEGAGLVSRGRAAQFRPVRLNAAPAGSRPPAGSATTSSSGPRASIVSTTM